MLRERQQYDSITYPKGIFRTLFPVRGSSVRGARRAQYLAYKATEGRPIVETAKYIGVPHRFYFKHSDPVQAVASKGRSGRLFNGQVWYRVQSGARPHNITNHSRRNWRADLYTGSCCYTSAEAEVLEQVQHGRTWGPNMVKEGYAVFADGSWSDDTCHYGRLLIRNTSREVTVLVQFVRDRIDRRAVITDCVEIHELHNMVGPRCGWNIWFGTCFNKAEVIGENGINYIHKEGPEILQ